MDEAQQDTQRAIAAARALLDGRDPETEAPQILITLDHLIAMMLVITQGGDHRKAVQMLHEGTVPHVEERIAIHANRE